MTRLLLALVVIAVWVGLTTAAAALTPDRGVPDAKPDLAVDEHWAQRIPPNPVESDRRPPPITAPPTTTTTRHTTPPPTTRAAAPRPQTRAVSGTCTDWLAAAHVDDVPSAVALISRESGCNPYAVNRHSGACGVAQELPCGKSGCALGDGACEVAWMDGYVHSRYGSWGNALTFQIRNGWY